MPTRLISAVLIALTALTLTACRNGEGLRDEGPSSKSTTISPSPRQAPR
ncbi:hypothetical protein [Streptomyces graminofaciens]|nr:hypothetical protein [Streptomyces graminofaciens]